MRWRWLFWDYADPELPLTRRQRIRLVTTNPGAGKMPPRLWRGRIFFVLSIMALVIVAIVAYRLLGRKSTGGIGSTALILCAWLFVLMVWISLMYGMFCRREVLFHIRQQGFDVCWNCGYWLRGLDDDVKHCPECGAEREAMPDSAD